jgi:3-oxoacyl-[acyl-carrier protein] reductase
MNKTALITGGAGGIGKGLISYLQNQKWNCLSLDINNPHTGKPEPGLLKYKVDIGDPEEIARGFEKIYNALESLDALICLAGVVHDAPVVGIKNKKLSVYPTSHWNSTMAVNLSGTFFCCREYAFRQIKRRQKGVIITCSSPAAVGAPGQSAYAASKAGIEAFTNSLARELAPWGIRVCGFSPAFTITPMAEKYPEPIRTSLAQKSLLRRPAELEEISKSIYHLMINELAIGRIFAFDGGIRL